MQGTWIHGSEGERYLVREELGRGAMGVVLLAEEAPQGRLVVLKVLLGSTLTSARLLRFSREGEIAARLSHPGIVPIHRMGRLQDGRPYLCFAHVAGARDLAQEFLQAPLARRLDWLMEAGAALGFAHQAGIVHRDLKLENLLVDAGGRVRVADFGVALLSEEERLTQSGALVGTPHTMAPEQATGQRHLIGPASDVWALGVLLYLACAGRYPFVGATQVEVLSRIVGASPPPLEETSPALAAVCARALQGDPAKRYESGAEFADALELATLSLGAAPRRSLGPALGLAGACLALGVGLGIVVRGPDSPSDSPGPSLRVGPSSPAQSEGKPTPTPPSEPAELLARAGELAAQQDPGAELAYRAAGEAGSAAAWEWLAANGPQAERSAFRRRAAEAGSASAALGLAKSLADEDSSQARSWLRRAAKAKPPLSEAMVLLSHSLRDAQAGPVNAKQADAWFEQALEAGEPRALLERGRREYRTRLQSRGAERVRQAAEAGHAEASLQLGRWLATGWRGHAPDLAEAEVQLRRALAAEVPDAAGHLGRILFAAGKSLEAERLWREKAAAGDRLAQAEWARHLCYHLGRKTEGRKLLQAAAEADSPHPRALLHWARLLNAGGKRQEALAFAQRAAKAGEVEAKPLIAELWMRRGARREALELLQSALDEGVGVAGLALSSISSDGPAKARYMREGAALHEPSILGSLSQSAARAKRFDLCRDYLERAAATGDSSAHVLLANFHERGLFGQPDLDQAELHWLEGARRRRSEAAVGLAKLVALRPQSSHRAEAKLWLLAACKRGDVEAIKTRQGLGW